MLIKTFTWVMGQWVKRAIVILLFKCLHATRFHTWADWTLTNHVLYSKFWLASNENLLMILGGLGSEHSFVYAWHSDTKFWALRTKKETFCASHFVSQRTLAKLWTLQCLKPKTIASIIVKIISSDLINALNTDITSTNKKNNTVR